jgi:hypothetical protein
VRRDREQAGELPGALRRRTGGREDTAYDRPHRRARDRVNGDAGFEQDVEDSDMRQAPGATAAEGQHQAGGTGLAWRLWSVLRLPVTNGVPWHAMIMALRERRGPGSQPAPGSRSVGIALR